MTITDTSSIAMDVVADLAIACAQQTSRRQIPSFSDADPCYELFRRALAQPPDEEAWQALVTQYSRLVRNWLGDYANDDTCQDVFIRFWKAQHGSEAPMSARFPNTSAIMAYLRQCTLTVRIELERVITREIRLEAALRATALVETTLLHISSDHHPDADVNLQQSIVAYLETPQERAVFDLRYRYNLRPREIQAQRPDLFPDVQVVYRVQENLIKRLRRNVVLRRIWEGKSAALDGGNAFNSSVQ